jgi:hypothetical protein
MASFARGPDACRQRPQNSAGHLFNTVAVNRMSPQQFAERDPAGETRQWLTAIAELVAGAS